MGARTREYVNLMWERLGERHPKATSRFKEFYSVLSYKAGWDWLKDGPGVRPFDSLPVFLRIAVLSEFFWENDLFEAKAYKGDERFVDNIIERGLFESFAEYEAKLINQPG